MILKAGNRLFRFGTAFGYAIKDLLTFGILGGSYKWIGGVLAPNGMIYGIPRDSTSILEIDPVSKTATTFGSLTGTAKWVSGVLAPNGKIYGIPLNSTSILEIDPVAKTATTFGSLAGSGKWFGGVLAPNGKVYGIPSNSTSILEYNLKITPSVLDILIPSDLSTLATSNYNMYYNKL